MEHILILGANSEIGQSVAEEYAAKGYSLYLADSNIELLNINKQKLEETFEEINIQVFKFDVIEFYNHRNFYSNLNPKPIGVISTVEYIGNQARAQKDFLETKKIIDTNFTGLVSIINIIANDFEARDTGFITGLDSTVGSCNKKQLYTYYSSKSAFINYLYGLKKRFHNTGVKVVTVNPGFVDTEVTKSLLLKDKTVISPQKTAKIILKAQSKGKDVTYKKGLGKFKMIIKDTFIKH